MMNKNKQNLFFSPTKGQLTFEEVINEIFLFLNECKEGKYEIVIGTDSQQKEKISEFATVIVIHWVGHFARYFLKKTAYHKMQSLRERIYNEAILSLDISQRVSEVLKNKISKEEAEPARAGRLLKYELEIHVDIGQNGPTKNMIKEIVGMIEANGFRVKIKPDAFAASTVADRHT